MNATEFGIVRLRSEKQFSQHIDPIEVTPLAIITDTTVPHPLSALDLIVLDESVIDTGCSTLYVESPSDVAILVSTTQADVALVSVLTINVGTVTVCKEVQPLKALFPNEDLFVRMNSLSERQP